MKEGQYIKSCINGRGAFGSNTNYKKTTNMSLRGAKRRSNLTISLINSIFEIKKGVLFIVLALFSLQFIFTSTLRAEEEWLQDSILQGIDLIYNTDIKGGESLFLDIIKRSPENPAPYIYRAMALMSYPPREGGVSVDREVIKDLLWEGIDLVDGKEWGDDRGKKLLLLATAYSLLTQVYLEENSYLRAGHTALYAREYLEDAYEVSPDDPDVLYAVGLMKYGMENAPELLYPILSLLSIEGDKEIGLLYLKKAADEGVYTAATASFMLLMVLSNLEEDFSGAVKYGRKLITTYPDNPEIYFPYAYSLSQIGDFSGALEVVDAFRQKMDEGYPYFDRALVGRFHHLVGAIYMDMGRLDEAYLEFERALVVEDENYEWVAPLALAKLGMVEDLRGNRDKAITRYREVIGMDIPGVGMELAERHLEVPYRRE